MLNQNHAILRAAAGVVLVAVSMNLATHDAGAQQMRRAFVMTDGDQMMHFGGGARFDALLRPDYSMRDMALIAQTLDLDDGQRAVVEMYLANYVKDFNDAAQPLRDAMKGYGGPFKDGNFAFKKDMAQELRDNVIDAIAPHLVGADLDDLIVNDDAVVFHHVEVGDGSHGVWAIDGATDHNMTFDVKIKVAGDAEETELTEEQLEAIKGRIKQFASDDLAKEIEKQLEKHLEQAFDEQGDVDEQQRVEPAEVVARARNFLTERNALRDTMHTNLQAVLADDQTIQWPALKRSLARQTSLPHGRLSGESLDLVRCVSQAALDADQRAHLQPVIDEYQAAVADALAARDEFVRRGEIDLFEAVTSQDADRRLSLQDQSMVLRRTVRDINLAYADQVSDILGDDAGEELLDDMHRTAFSSIYRTSRAERMMRKALELDNLDDDTQAAIRDLQSQLKQAQAAARDGMRETILKDETTRHRRMAKFHETFRNGEIPTFEDDPMMRIHREQRKLSKTFSTQLEALLTPEQLEQIRPKRSEFIIRR